MDRICGLSIMDRSPIHYAQSADPIILWGSSEGVSPSVTVLSDTNP
ncbi:unnamed protein product, partial [Staurois parvus]